MTYDKEKWHAAGLSKGTPRRQAFVHIAMYLTWVIARRLHDSAFFAALPQGDRYLKLIASRKRTAMSMRGFLDGSLPSELLSREGRAFTDWYYAEPHARYLDDWVSEFGEDANSYRVRDSWETFDRIAARIDAQFRPWRQGWEEPGGGRRVQPQSDSVPPLPPPGGNPVEAARRAIAAAGGVVVPGPFELAQTEFAAGLTSQQLAQLAAELESESQQRQRVAITKLAAAPMTDDVAALLRRAAESSDPVVSAIAAHALGSKH